MRKHDLKIGFLRMKWLFLYDFCHFAFGSNISYKKNMRNVLAQMWKHNQLSGHAIFWLFFFGDKDSQYKMTVSVIANFIR